MFLLATDYRKNTDLFAIKTPLVFNNGFFVPIDFSEFPEKSHELGVSYNPLIIEGWYVFAIKDFERSTLLNYKIKLIEKIKETILLDKKSNEKFFLEFYKNDYLNSYLIYFKFLNKKTYLDQETLERIDTVFQFFKELKLIDKRDIIPLLKLFFTQVDLNLPYVHYTNETNNKYTLLYFLDSFIFAVNFKTFEDYENLAYLLEKIEKEVIFS
jgi:hypothetical protein